MATRAETADGYLMPLAKVGGQHSEERKSGRCTSYLKAICSKAKNSRKDNNKRRFCSTMDLSSIKSELNIITLTDNGKLVSRRKSFQDDVPKSGSHYEYLMLENLLGLSSDVNQKAINRTGIVNRSQHSNNSNIEDHVNRDETFMGDREKISNRRLRRRDAVAQVTQRTREVLVERLRALALENSLINNGLLK